MIPNNNLSVLPWYTSIEQQNARKWWVYNRVYPLFTPAGFMLPFQILREGSEGIDKGQEIFSDDADAGLILQDGTWYTGPEAPGNVIERFDVSGEVAVFFQNLPKPMRSDLVSVAARDLNGNVLGTFRPNESAFISGKYYKGGWELPEGTVSIIVQTYVETTGQTAAQVFKGIVTQAPQVTSFVIFTKNGEPYATCNPDEMGFTYKNVLGGLNAIIFGGQMPVFAQFADGQYYAVLSDGVNVWYSEIFTVVNDIEPYLKIVWWDVEDFTMDAGTIVYRYAGGAQFRNVLYLQADIAKPEYTFEEEGETRDGYFFPIKQISEKRYRFSFLASEYLLDVMRFIRMADYAQIEKNGQVYNLDTFLITPEWEDNGDVAAVSAEFDTATVAKKIGRGYIQPDGGDFNNDFNNDYNSQQ